MIRCNRKWILWSACLTIVLSSAAFLAVLVRQSRHREKPILEWAGTRTITPGEHNRLIGLLRSSGLSGVVVLPKDTPESKAINPTDPATLGIVRSEVCAECHESQWQGCQATAHYRTSSEPSRQTIRGSFATTQNMIHVVPQQVWYEMVAYEQDFYQDLFIRNEDSSFKHRARFDIVIGSGNLGQSYLYWSKNGLFQLPVSYYSGAARWAVSPGSDFPEGTANFARPIGERCLDCHATWFDRIPETLNQYFRGTYMLGVTCTRCHGKAVDHVKYHRDHPKADEPHMIVNPAKLPRDQANSICAQCHAGEGRLVSRGFTYQPGRPLSEFLQLDHSKPPDNIPDVHAANQIHRLSESRCYQESNLTCFTCHNPHRDEHRKTEVFVQHCLKCHEAHDCGKRAALGAVVDRLCIDCHMPSTQELDFKKHMRDESLIPLMRDHLIKVWPEATRSVIAKIVKPPVDK